MKIGNKVFENYTFVMAIINLTPDSFWQNSRNTADSALFAVEKAINDGAAVIDIGAQSTRPDYTEISAEEEISRFEKPLQEIRKRFDIPLSVDTYFSKSARAALEIGADMINDIWGLTHDGKMAETIAEFNASACVMHNAKTRLTGDIWGAITNFLQESVQKALNAGIQKDRICLDGGIGFAKDREQNFELLNGYEKLCSLGYPLLLGTSRKSMFGGAVEDRLEPTLRSTRLAAKKGVLFVRVHDVKENVQAIKQTYEKVKEWKF